MTDIAIKVENLGKQYRIGARREQYRTLRGALVSGVKRLTTKRSMLESSSDTIWALKDVSFEVKQGEVVGIIGRNGAGKSTLLKVLSHITEPTKGRVLLYGRVGSLLEVGTGFHPELTGRDNIYLNGAILGMKREEVVRKFDEIVAFSEIEKFLDTPVKRYSSGMYVRLAFAVAAHLEPEILVVDEVLAVGDAEFQKKCLGKMGQESKAGRTILFVSHNMPAIKSFCPRSLYLENGKVVFDGETEIAVQKYRGETQDQLMATFPPDANKAMRIKRIEICPGGGKAVGADEIDTADGIQIKLTYHVNKSVTGAHAFIRIQTDNGETLLSTGDADTEPDMLGLRKPGEYSCHINIPPRILGAGRYTLTWSAGIPFQENFDVEWYALVFHLVDNRTNRANFIHKERPGLLALDLDWDYEKRK
jgi:lipopolysaccharide transport system ATP-binding protein